MKVTINGFIHAKRWVSAGEYEYLFFSTDMSEHGYIVVVPHTVEFDLPEGFDPRPAEVEMLRAKKREIQAETEVKLRRLDEEISKLLCIEHKPEMV